MAHLGTEGDREPLFYFQAKEVSELFQVEVDGVALCPLLANIFKVAKLLQNFHRKIGTCFCSANSQKAKPSGKYTISDLDSNERASFIV